MAGIPVDAKLFYPIQPGKDSFPESLSGRLFLFPSVPIGSFFPIFPAKSRSASRLSEKNSNMERSRSW
jgi:hypothetical protein